MTPWPQIKAVQAAGKLASDELVMRVVEERTAMEDAKRGYVLDGFPRTMKQAEMLKDLAASQGHDVVAIVVDVPFDLLEKRATGRLSCPVCGEIYNLYFKPPKIDKKCDDHPDTDLIQRADDTAEKIKVRLETYNQQTKPLIDYYGTTGRLHRIDGTKPQKKSTRRLKKYWELSDLSEVTGISTARMIIGKSKKEIDKMRASGQLVGSVLRELRGMVTPGITTIEIDRAAER